MNGAKLIALAYYLDRERPDLSHVERANLAVQMMIRGDVTIDVNGDLRLDEKARALAAKPTPPDPTPPPPEPEPERNVADELRADLAKVTGSDDKSKVRRAHLRAQLAQYTLDSSGPAISDDLAADLAAVRGRTLGEERAKRAMITEAHARRKLEGR